MVNAAQSKAFSLKQALLSVATLCSSTCRGTIYDTRFDGVTWDDTNWRIKTTTLDQGHYQSRASIANGYIGINVASLGPFFEVDTPVAGDNINGWPLFGRRQTFATVGGFYDVQPTTNGSNFPWLDALGGESVISGIPHWSGLIVEYNDHVLNASTDASEITGYSSTLDIGSGMISWQYTWTPPDSPSFDVEYSLFAHKLYVNQAVTQLKLTASRQATVQVSDVFDGDCAVRTTFVNSGYLPKKPVIWTAVQPNNIPYSTAFVYSTLSGDDSVDMSSRRRMNQGPFTGYNVSSIAQTVDVKLQAGNAATIEKYVGIASTDAFESPRSVASKASATAAEMGYVKMLKTHIKEWNSIMSYETVDSFHLPNGSLPTNPDLIEQQILAVSNPYALLQNTVGTNAIAAAGNNENLNIHSISVGGLTSDSYAGLIFWDAEVWMSPGLVVTYPDAALQISEYRRVKYEQAQKNIMEAYTSSQNETHFSSNAAVFPWTSGRFGNCTGTGPCFDYEYHLNGDIGLNLETYYWVTGDQSKFKSDFFPIYDSIAELYSNLIFLNKTTGTYNLDNATDPDEYANMINNPGYTMALMKQHLKRANAFRKEFSIAPSKLWTRQSKKMEIPIYKPANIILEYSSMNGSIEVKQADVVLIDDFLDYPNPYTLSDLEFYAGRQTLNGPAMTFGVFAIIAAGHIPSGCSHWTYDLYGSQPYVRAPWFQYSEQLVDNFQANGGTHPAYPFLTGMGGANRVAVYGYLGLKVLPDSLNINPSLPPQITNLRYRKIYWQGHAISATANTTHTTITRLSESLPNANPQYSGAAIPVTIGQTRHTYSLSTTLTFPNRQPALNQTVPGNLAQCRPVSSNRDYSPGQFPLSAVDGSRSTAWKPSRANALSSLTVDLGDAGVGATITGFEFDWAQAPAKAYYIAFSNSTAVRGRTNITQDENVKISNPYRPARAAKITAYMSNTTSVTLDAPVRGARYATLTITGNQIGGDSTGASVAEWAIIEQGGGSVKPRGVLS